MLYIQFPVKLVFFLMDLMSDSLIISSLTLQPSIYFLFSAITKKFHTFI